MEIYIAQMSGGKMNGFGMEFCNNELYYIGCFKDNCYDNFGLWSYGNTVYVGEFQMNSYCGIGACVKYSGTTA